MKTFIKSAACALLSLFFVGGLTSCSNDDPDFSNTLPSVKAVYTISGSVSDMQGNALPGATITISGAQSGTATTVSNGTFIFSDLKPGTYTVKIEAEGKFPEEKVITIPENADGYNAVVNVMLQSLEAKKEIEVKADQPVEEETTSESLSFNKNAEIDIDVDAPAGTFDKDGYIYIVPLYDPDRAAAVSEGGRADDPDDMLIGATLERSDESMHINSGKYVEITFNLDATTAANSVVKKFNVNNDSWEEVSVEARATASIDGGKVVIKADEFTSYGVFMNVNVTSTSTTETLTFNPATFNNLNGTSSMNAGESRYTYKVGMDIKGGNTVFEALLVEFLARRYGANMRTVETAYPLGVTLPIGSILYITGYQNLNTVTATTPFHSVSGIQYADVVINVTIDNSGTHDGGTN